MTTMANVFLRDAPRLLTDMRAAVEAGDGPRLRVAAHTLKSNSRDFGALAVSTHCARIEAVGKRAIDVAEAAADLEWVEQEMPRVLDAVRELALQ